MSLLLSPLSQLMKRVSNNANKINSIFEKNPITMNAITGFITFAGGDIVARNVVVNDNNNNNKNHIDSNTNTNNNIRTVLTGLLGAVMNGFILTGWYIRLDRIIGNSMNNKRQILMKCLCDQFIYSPLAIVVFFGHSSFFNAWKHTNSNSSISSSSSSSSSSNSSNISTSITNSNSIGNRIYNTKQVYDKENDINVSVCGSSMIENSNPSNPNNFFDYAKLDFTSKMTTKFFDAYIADCFFWPGINWLNFRYLPLHFRPSLVAVAQFGWQAILSTINSSDKSKAVLPSSSSTTTSTTTTSTSSSS